MFNQIKQELESFFGSDFTVEHNNVGGYAVINSKLAVQTYLPAFDESKSSDVHEYVAKAIKEVKTGLECALSRY